MILLQAQGQGGIMNIVFLVGIFVVFYFFMIRPQQKKQKDQKKLREGLKKGDYVVTIGGIYGKVVEVEEAKVTLDVDRGTKLVCDKSAVSGLAE